MKVQTTKNDPNNRGEGGHFELKNVIISTWLGRRDSNPRMPGPKPGALPLGDGPLLLEDYTTGRPGVQRIGRLRLPFGSSVKADSCSMEPCFFSSATMRCLCSGAARANILVLLIAFSRSSSLMTSRRRASNTWLRVRTMPSSYPS